MLFKEVARGGERTRVLSISFYFLIFTTLPLSHSGYPFSMLFNLLKSLFDFGISLVAVYKPFMSH
jgi:hypothetical protein